MAKDDSIMKTTRQNLFIALAAALVITLIARGGLLRRVDKWTQDRLFQQPAITSPEIILFGIDEKALNELGPYHTWSRAVMASALERLADDPAHLPAVVAIDTLYAGESNPEADERLARAAKALPATVTASMAEIGTAYQADARGGLTVDSYAVLDYVSPYTALKNASIQGHINAMYDADGILRHSILYVDVPAEINGEKDEREIGRAHV